MRMRKCGNCDHDFDEDRVKHVPMADCLTLMRQKVAKLTDERDRYRREAQEAAAELETRRQRLETARRAVEASFYVIGRMECECMVCDVCRAKGALREAIQEREDAI